MATEAPRRPEPDPAELVARVAMAKRDLLLGVYRRRMRREDLEDCYSQATLELLARARRDGDFASPQHVGNALEQKFASRIKDRHRALGGRSAAEMALAAAASIDDGEGPAGQLADRGADVPDQLAARHELSRLREVAADLTDDQRLVLACQIGLDMGCGEFCRRFGWSAEKFRKVSQRARAKLRVLVGEYHQGERCRELEPALTAYLAGTAGAAERDRVLLHLENCSGCAAGARQLDIASRRVAALLPSPLVLAPATAKLGVLMETGRHLLRAGSSTSGGHMVGASGGAAVGAGGALGTGGAALGTGGSILGVGGLKLGMAALCVAGAAGYVCERAGLVPSPRRPPPGLHSSRPARAHGHPVAGAGLTRPVGWASGGRAQPVRPPRRSSPARRRAAGPNSAGAARAQAQAEFGLADGAARSAPSATSVHGSGRGPRGPGVRAHGARARLGPSARRAPYARGPARSSGAAAAREFGL